MKKVVGGDALLDNILDAVLLLCDPVSSTLGPMGKDVIISDFASPFVTNDGVSIAKCINSCDEVINSILSLCKEASLKVDLEVGDGTTTTLVLFKALMVKGISLIKSGKNGVVLKNELNEALSLVLDRLKTLLVKPLKKDLLKIAINAANDEEIGRCIFKAYTKVLNKGGIKILEGEEKCSVSFINGYVVPCGLCSSFLLGTSNSYEFLNPYVLLLDRDVDDLNFCADAINSVLKSKASLVIMANFFSEEVINQVREINLNGGKICLVLNTDYAKKRKEILNDLAFLLDASLTGDGSFSSLGQALAIEGNLDETIIRFKKDKGQVKRYIRTLEKKALSSYEKELLDERISNINCLSARVLIGGLTKTIRKEKLMRAIDALEAISFAHEGILLGEGVSLLSISDNIFGKNDGYEILCYALTRPFKQIMENLGLDGDYYAKEAKSRNFNYVYNYDKKVWEGFNETFILDDYVVLKKALEASCAMASVLFSTSYLVVNESLDNDKMVL